MASGEAAAACGECEAASSEGATAPAAPPSGAAGAEGQRRPRGKRAKGQHGCTARRAVSEAGINLTTEGRRRRRGCVVARMRIALGRSRGAAFYLFYYSLDYRRMA